MSVITLKAKEYQVLAQETEKGYSIELSAYDIPREVEGKLDPKSGVFHIDFKYLDQEEAVVKKLTDELNMKLGRYSGKILGFEVEVAEHGINNVTLKLAQAVQAEISKEISNLRKFNQKANYKIIQSILKRKQEPIFADVAGAR